MAIPNDIATQYNSAWRVFTSGMNESARPMISVTTSQTRRTRDDDQPVASLNGVAPRLSSSTPGPATARTNHRKRPNIAELKTRPAVQQAITQVKRIAIGSNG